MGERKPNWRDVTLRVIIGMMALGIGIVTSRHLSDGVPAGIVVMAAFLLLCYLVIAIISGIENKRGTEEKAG